MIWGGICYFHSADYIVDDGAEENRLIVETSMGSIIRRLIYEAHVSAKKSIIDFAAF